MNQKRSPIVTVLGHVDHGKTSLLDALRKTNIVSREAGGITQSIGASVVETKDGQKITFIDTPGHAIFTNMRSRGAGVADIALLVVDSTDGVKPQTKEAISLIQSSNIPFVVVVTKIDLPTSSVENTLAEIEKEGIYFEGRGGQTPYVAVSARKGDGLNDLLDLIALMAEVNNIEGDSLGLLEAYVIETNKDRAGNVVSVVVKNGQLEVGKEIYATRLKAKIKGLYDFQNKMVKSILPGQPAKVLGFEELPDVGVLVSDDPNLASQEQNSVTQKLKIDKDKIAIFLKAQSMGSLEALKASIPSEFVVIDASIGDLTESDVMNAKASGASIFVFESKVSSNVKKLAEMDKVTIYEFNIIYELLQKLEEIIKSGLTEILGKAEILGSFPFDGKKVAGCKVLQGSISKNSDLRLYRDEKELGKVKILSIKKQKTEVQTVSQGEEFGIFFAPQLDFAVGDVILAVKANGQ